MFFNNYIDFTPCNNLCYTFFKLYKSLNWQYFNNSEDISRRTTEKTIKCPLLNIELTGDIEENRICAYR